MPLANFDFARAREELQKATQEELPRVAELRAEIARLKVVDLGYRQCLAVAPVATDGGENRLTFEPLNVELIRVADSEGREHLQMFVPLSASPDRFKEAFSQVALLRRFVERLDVDYKDLSYFLPGNKREPDDDSTDEDLRKYVRSFRDIAEWAALLDLAWSDVGVRLLVIRDGLLRSKSLSVTAMVALANSFQAAHAQTGTYVVGVAKQSKVLSYLSLALVLEGSLRRESPCFAEVPESLERKCYNFAATWMKGQAFGTMHLAKLVEGPDAPVYPVDIPQWLLTKRKEVLEYLAETAKASFPSPGYPAPLARAHDNANLGGLEMSLLGDMLVRAVADAIPQQTESVLRHVAFGRGLVRGGIKGAS